MEEPFSNRGVSGTPACPLWGVHRAVWGVLCVLGILFMFEGAPEDIRGLWASSVHSKVNSNWEDHHWLCLSSFSCGCSPRRLVPLARCTEMKFTLHFNQLIYIILVVFQPQRRTLVGCCWPLIGSFQTAGCLGGFCTDGWTFSSAWLPVLPCSLLFKALMIDLWDPEESLWDTKVHEASDVPWRFWSHLDHSAILWGDHVFWTSAQSSKYQKDSQENGSKGCMFIYRWGREPWERRIGAFLLSRSREGGDRGVEQAGLRLVWCSS